MKKMMITILAVALTAGLLTGCAGAAPAEKPAEETVTEEKPAEEVKPDEKPAEEAVTDEEPAEEAATDDEPSTETGYKKMWISESARESEDDDVFEINGEYGPEELLNSLKKADWDNDGVNEYVLCGGIAYSGVLFDMDDGELTALYGFGPYGMGWNDVAYIDDAYWFYEASGNSGKFYDFYKYNPEHEVADRFCYEINYEMNEDGTEEKVTCTKGTDYENMSEISEAEFNEMCGESGIISQELPELTEDDNEEFTKELHGAIEDFLAGKRPALSGYGY